MNRESGLTGLLLVFALLAGGCGGAGTAFPPSAVSAPASVATATAAEERPIAPTAVGVSTAAPTLMAAATSRGPELEASNPEEVRLDAGGVQLVEFFRFT